jgi:hypothetical protein
VLSSSSPRRQENRNNPYAASVRVAREDRQGIDTQGLLEVQEMFGDVQAPWKSPRKSSTQAMIREYTSAHMAGLTLAVGIVLLITASRTAPGKNGISGTASIILIVFTILFAAFAVWVGMKVPAQAPEMIGQAAGHLIVLIFFVAIGTGIRKLRERSAGKDNSTQ